MFLRVLFTLNGGAQQSFEQETGQYEEAVRVMSKSSSDHLLLARASAGLTGCGIVAHGETAARGLL